MPEQKLGHTVDGIEITPGMAVYLVNNDEIDYNKYVVVEQVVGSIADSGRKVLFKNPPPNGYSGARIDGVYGKREIAEKVAANPPWQVRLILDEHDASLVQYVLGKELVKVQGELTLLQIAAKRDLEQYERAALPVNIRDYTREELAESIDPWISLFSHVSDLLKIVTNKLEAAKAEPTFIE